MASSETAVTGKPVRFTVIDDEGEREPVAVFCDTDGMVAISQAGMTVRLSPAQVYALVWELR